MIAIQSANTQPSDRLDFGSDPLAREILLEARSDDQVEFGFRAQPSGFTRPKQTTWETGAPYLGSRGDAAAMVSSLEGMMAALIKLNAETVKSNQTYRIDLRDRAVSSIIDSRDAILNGAACALAAGIVSGLADVGAGAFKAGWSRNPPVGPKGDLATEAKIMRQNNVAAAGSDVISSVGGQISSVIKYFEKTYDAKGKDAEAERMRQEQMIETHDGVINVFQQSLQSALSSVGSIYSDRNQTTSKIVGNIRG